jgi:2-polyprenyl-3-methyl-5-hydroxy-6-metoxy-1,4-benzoquinol methylase
MKRLDWTELTDDPNNRAAKAAVRDYLLSARKVHTGHELTEFVETLIAGKSVLDIGVVEHARRYFDNPGWRHERIARAASRCLGVDILEPLVKELASRGFNVACVDATSERDLGERFEVAFVGDVMEHVNDPVRLLQFGARHLIPGGRLYATTPNPFSRKFYRRLRREGTMIVNLDHVFWITPTQAMEIGRRAGIPLVAYHLVKRYAGARLALKRLAWKFSPIEWSFPDFLYEFAAYR